MGSISGPVRRGSAGHAALRCGGFGTGRGKARFALARIVDQRLGLAPSVGLIGHALRPGMTASQRERVNTSASVAGRGRRDEGYYERGFHRGTIPAGGEVHAQALRRSPHRSTTEAPHRTVRVERDAPAGKRH